MCTEYKAAWLHGGRHDCLGHEAVGTVAEVAQPGRVAVGQRVVDGPHPVARAELCVAGDHIHCEQGVSVQAFTGSPSGAATYAQYLVKPDWLCSPIPADLSDERAGLGLCGLGPSIGAFDRMNVTAFDTVLITGLGPVGLGGVANAAYRGAKVIAVDTNGWRRRGRASWARPKRSTRATRTPWLVSARLPADTAPTARSIAPAAPARTGCCSMRSAAAARSRSSGRPAKAKPPCASRRIRSRGFLQPARSAGTTTSTSTPSIVQVLRDYPPLDKLVSHVFPMSRVQDAFETLAGQQTAKVMLRPWE